MPRRTSTNQDAIRLGAMLARLRRARGWSITTTRRCGMNPNYLGALEKGANMPSVETLLEAAEVYGISAADTVREVEEARRAAREA